MVRIIELFQPLRRSFPSWVQDRYRAAVAELEKLNDRSPRYLVFAWECIASAENARAWQAANKCSKFDRDETMRQSDLEYLEHLKSTISLMNKLTAHMEKFPFQSAWAVGNALMRLKDEVGFMPLKASTITQEGVNPIAYGPGTAPDIMCRILRHMSGVLEEMPLAKSEAFSHWKCFGPIIYEKSRFGRIPDTLVTGLLFETLFFSRTFTSGGLLPPAFRSPMPSGGRPHWALAVALLSGAINVDLTEKEAQDRMSLVLDGTFCPTWAGWHDPPEEFHDFPKPEEWI